MIAVLVGDHVVTWFRGETIPASGNFRRENGYAVLDDRRVLLRERNLDAQLLGLRPAAEQHLDALPVFSPRSEVKRQHFFSRCMPVAIGPSIEERPDVIGFA